VTRRLTPEQFRALKPRRRKQQDAADYFARAWELRPLAGVEMVREYQFHPTRKWRLDIAFPGIRLAVEVDGRGTDGSHGRHHSVVGARRDFEKHNAAVVLGWRILRFAATDKGRVNQWVEQVKKVIGGGL
jgi:very-short-patch-repair endonuclease